MLEHGLNKIRNYAVCLLWKVPSNLQKLFSSSYVQRHFSRFLPPAAHWWLFATLHPRGDSVSCCLLSTPSTAAQLWTQFFFPPCRWRVQTSWHWGIALHREVQRIGWGSKKSRDILSRFNCMVTINCGRRFVNPLLPFPPAPQPPTLH